MILDYLPFDLQNNKAGVVRRFLVDENLSLY
jgi:hypothetical protein